VKLSYVTLVHRSDCCTGSTKGSKIFSSDSANFAEIESWYDMKSKCAKGKYGAKDAAGAQCNICGKGTYALAKAVSCAACGLGMFQPQSRQRSCIYCASGQATDSTGSTSAAACTTCVAGKAAKRGTCTTCRLNTYQPMAGKETCIACPQGKVTRSIRSIAAEACSVQTAVVKDIIDAGRSASSIYSNDLDVKHGRLSSQTSWSTKTNAVGQWYQMDASQTEVVAGVAIKGQDKNKYQSEWVKTFKVKISTDKSKWTEVDSGATFKANTNRNTQIFVLVKADVQARYVRIFPQTWNNHMSMRCGLLIQPSICEPGTAAPATIKDAAKCKPCGAGQYAPANATLCSACPIATHQARTAQGTCMACAKGLVTASPGAMNASACFVNPWAFCKSGWTSKYYAFKQVGSHVPSPAELASRTPDVSRVDALNFYNDHGGKAWLKGLGFTGQFASTHVTYMKAAMNGTYTSGLTQQVAACCSL